MKKIRSLYSVINGNRGVTATIVVILMVVFLGFAALVIDLGYAYITKNELQNIADASALAGARWLGKQYETMPYSEQLSYSESVFKPPIIEVIGDIALQNQAGGLKGLSILEEDIVIGNWDTEAKKVVYASVSPDAVSVVVRRDSSSNNPISTFFANIIGTNTIGLTAEAAAALTGQSTMGPGGLPFPVALDKKWMETLPCNDNITFHPSSAGICAGWHAYDGKDYEPTGAEKKGMPQLLDDLKTGKYTSPETIAGVTQYDFSNGEIAKLFVESKDLFFKLFEVMRIKNDGVLDNDLDDDTWTTSIPIFDDPSLPACNPNGLLTIVGFTSITITGVSGTPEKTIYAQIKCDAVEPGRGGGNYYGTKGSIPGLVK